MKSKAFVGNVYESWYPEEKKIGNYISRVSDQRLSERRSGCNYVKSRVKDISIELIFAVIIGEYVIKYIIYKLSSHKLSV